MLLWKFIVCINVHMLLCLCIVIISWSWVASLRGRIFEFEMSMWNPAVSIFLFATFSHRKKLNNVEWNGNAMVGIFHSYFNVVQHAGHNGRNDDAILFRKFIYWIEKLLRWLYVHFYSPLRCIVLFSKKKKYSGRHEYELAIDCQ